MDKPMRVAVLPRGSEAGSDHFFVLDASGRGATCVRVNPDGTVYAWVPDRDERISWRSMVTWAARRNAAYWL